MKLNVNITINSDLLESVRKSNSLARDMSDNELIEMLKEFAEELNNDLGLVLENLDYFNQ